MVKPPFSEDAQVAAEIFPIRRAAHGAGNCVMVSENGMLAGFAGLEVPLENAAAARFVSAGAVDGIFFAMSLMTVFDGCCRLDISTLVSFCRAGVVGDDFLDIESAMATLIKARNATPNIRKGHLRIGGFPWA